MIEVVTVLLILSIVTVVSVPAFLPESMDDETAAATEIAAVLRSAALAARTRATPVTVTLDSATLHYWVHANADPEPIAEGDFMIRVNARIELSAARTVFKFEPTGAAWGPGIVIRGTGGTRRVTLDQWTGSVDREAASLRGSGFEERAR